MRISPLTTGLFLVLVLGALGVLFWGQGNNSRSSSSLNDGDEALDFLSNSGETDPQARIGLKLLSSEAFSKVSAINIKKGDQNLSLSKDESGRWLMEETDEKKFPASAKEIIQLFENLNETKFVRYVGEGEDILKEFELDQPTSLILSDSQETPILRLNLGSKRGASKSPTNYYASQEHYVSIGDEKSVFLLSDSIDASSNPTEWEHKTLVQITKDQIKEVSFVSSQPPVKLSRESADKELELQGTLPEGQEANASALSSAASMLESVDFTKRFDIGNEEAKTALSQSKTQVKVNLFDGRLLNVTLGVVGEEKKKYFIRIDPDMSQASVGTLIQDDMAWLQKIHQYWSFEIPSYVASRFDKKLEDFLQKESSTQAKK